MKAFIQETYGNDVLKPAEVERPAPKPSEVLVQVKATALNDWDVALTRGDQFVIRLMNGFGKPKTKIIGMEMAGIVVETGSDVKQFKVGDRVYGDLSDAGFGTFAEFVSTKASAFSHMPKNVSFAKAAAIPHASLLAWQALKKARLSPEGKQILINGAGGGVGSLGIQLLKKYNCEVTGVDSDKKLSQMRSWGFDHVIDYRTTDFTSTGNKYDIIIDAKSTRGPWKYAKALKPGGVYVTVGGPVPLLLRIVLAAPVIRLLQNKRIGVLGLKPNHDLEEITQIMEKGNLNPVIDGPHSFDRIPELLKYFEQGAHVGKVVIQTSE